jgi:hypothetical protein
VYILRGIDFRLETPTQQRISEYIHGTTTHLHTHIRTHTQRGIQWQAQRSNSNSNANMAKRSKSGGGASAHHSSGCQAESLRLPARQRGGLAGLNTGKKSPRQRRQRRLRERGHSDYVILLSIGWIGIDAELTAREGIVALARVLNKGRRRYRKWAYKYHYGINIG